MSLVVNTNIAGLNAQRNLGISNSRLGKSLERLSSGLRINKAADDAAGLAIATKFNAQVRGLNQAVRNSNNAIALLQTAEGGINTTTNILQRLRELAVQSSSDDNTSSDRTNLTLEADQLIAELTRVANTSAYNGMALLDGTFSGKYFQVGANYAEKITFSISDTRGKSIGGRAQYSADIADGVGNATNANLTTGEFKINGTDVAATQAADDQYSVLSISSGAVENANISQVVSGSLQFIINGISVDLATTVGTVFSASITNISVADTIVSAINSAGITNVTARTYDASKWVLEATGGTGLDLAAEASGLGTTLSALVMIGMDTVESMFGSGIAANAIDNYNGESSALAKGVAINAVKTTTNVTATVMETTITGATAISAGTTTTLDDGDIYINGVNIGGMTIAASDSTGTLVTAINNQTSSTGVTASKDTSGKLVLSAADGRNITISANEAATITALGISSTYFTENTAIFRATVQLNSEDSIALTSNLEDLTDSGSGATNDTTKSTSTSITAAADVASYNVALVEIDTQANAQGAILTIDAALNDVNAIRAQIGAVQNRIEFTVANLEIASENMSASESRIRDADFAAETAIFTRNQIMLQAGTAILAQANSLPQIALQLLG